MMGDTMKRIIVACLCMMLVLIASCKKRSDRRIAGNGYVIEEVLDSLPLVIVSDKEVTVVDLGSNDVLASYPLKSADVLETFLFKRTLFVVCKDVICRINVEDEEITKTKLGFTAEGGCGLDHKVVVWGNGAIYELSKNEKVEKLAEYEGRAIEVQSFPGYTSLVAVFEKEETFEMAKYSLMSKELERKEPIEDFVKMRISPFGKRIYVLTKGKLLFLDAKNLRFISEIPFEGEGVDFIVTASENKVFVFTRDPAKVISIKRTILKLEGECALSFPPSLKTITDDGATVFFLAADSLFRFDTGSNGIVKTAGKKANEVDMLLTTPKGLRVILGKRGQKVAELLNGNTLLLEKEVSVEGELLHLICGAEPFRPKQEEFSPDTFMGDSSSVESIPSAQMSTYFTLQVSSSSILEGAQKLMKEIKGKSLPVFIDSSETKDGATVYRVKVGAFESRKDAEKFSKGLKGTYGMDSWVSEQKLAPFYLSEAGIDINGDKSGEVLLYEKNSLYLFSNHGGVQRVVFTKEVEGANLMGTPLEIHDDNVVLLGVSFKPDSLIAVRWFDNKYEVLKRKAPQQ
jgi:hypothetical protein